MVLHFGGEIKDPWRVSLGEGMRGWCLVRSELKSAVDLFCSCLIIGLSLVRMMRWLRLRIFSMSFLSVSVAAWM